jgi:hypothetical protein
MGRLTGGAICLMVILAACGREGSPAVQANPTPPRVLTARSGALSAELTISPGRPRVGELVRFGVTMRYGAEPYTSKPFRETLLVKGLGRFGGYAACKKGRPSDTRPGFVDRNTHETRFTREGRYALMLRVTPPCATTSEVLELADAIEVAHSVSSLETLVWTDRDGLMRGKVTIRPARPQVGEPVLITMETAYEGRGERKRGEFAGGFMIEGVGGEYATAGCVAPLLKPGQTPAPPPPPESYGNLVQRRTRVAVYRHPGAHRVEFSAGFFCGGPGTSISIERDFVVAGASPIPDGVHRLPEYREHSFGGDSPQESLALAGDERSGCIWLKPKGYEGAGYAAIWPRFWFARFDPVRIYDENGKEVWREGRARTLLDATTNATSHGIREACRTSLPVLIVPNFAVDLR